MYVELRFQQSSMQYFSGLTQSSWQSVRSWGRESPFGKTSKAEEMVRSCSPT